MRLAVTVVAAGVMLTGCAGKNRAARAAVRAARMWVTDLYLQTEAITTPLPPSLANGKADNEILAVVMHLQRTHPRRSVILVSKDINMRIKARALGFLAEDYFNDKVLEDTDLLYSGVRELPADFWDSHGKGMESWQQNGRVHYRINGPLCRDLLVNEFVYQEGERPLHAIVSELNGRSAVLRTVHTRVLFSL